MNTSSHRPNLSTVQSVRSERGFALVIALSLMAFILLLLLSITTFVAVETKNAAASKERLQAEQNALLAAMQAIGQLQKELGPDQRITAAASVLELYADGDSNGVADSTLVHPQWLGSWSAWDSWLTDVDSDGHTLASTYTQGRSNKFNRWLVSHPDPVALEGASAHTVPANALAAGIELVEVVGVGSLGPSADPRLSVEVPRVGLSDNNGGYAWWVGGENQKAQVAASALPTDAFEELSRRSQRTDSGAEQLDGLSSLSTSLTELSKVSNFLSMGLLGDASAQAQIGEYYHDLTVESSGVLANVRDGRLKQDLNLLLENDILPAAFGTEDFLDNTHSGTIVPLRRMSNDVPLPSGPHSNTYSEYPGSAGEEPIYKKPNFTSWYKLHQYYSLYKNNTGPKGQERMRGSSAPEVEQFFAMGNRGGVDTNKPHEYLGFGYDLAPVVARVTTVYSLAPPEEIDSGRWEYRLFLSPLVTLWNPYNVTLRVPELSLMNPLANQRIKIYIDGTAAPGFSDWRGVQMSTQARSAVRGDLYLRESGNTEIVLRPGETRIYSIRPASQAPKGIEMYLERGYDPPFYPAGGILAPIDDGDLTDGYEHRLVITVIGTGLPNSTLPEVTLAMQLTDEIPNWTTHIGGFRALVDAYADVNGDWIHPGSGYSIPVIPDVAGQRQRFPAPDSTAATFASISNVLKHGEIDAQEYALVDDSGAAQPFVDYRCRQYIHADPANQRISQGQASDRAKAMGQYTLLVENGAGGSTALNVDGDRPYIGSALSLDDGDYPGQLQLTTHDIPVVPITSLASLMHFKLSPGLTGYDWNQVGSRLFDIAPNQALAIGNSFAHPLLPVDETYRDLPDFRRNFGSGEQSRYIYDHSFFNNDGLWDNWFCSGLTRQETGVGYFDQQRSIEDVVDDFIAEVAPLANAQLRLWKGGLSDSEVKSNLINYNSNLINVLQPAPERWDKAAAHLMLDGAFNVNSTSVAAWKAFLWGLRDTEINYLDPSSGSIQKASVPGDRVVLSRFTLPVSAGEGADAGDPDSWLGIRLLTKAQVDKLAEECVRQVKLRGPFLNMADFVNRRLEDSDLGQVGALQAAIDWDEWNGNSPSAGANDSINGRFKNSVDLITTADVSYTANNDLPEGNPALLNPEAATGSRWAGIPGYVTQADLLKRMGNQIAVRDDTFRIRAYGDTKDLSGKTVARALCEVVVQRMPDYMASIPDDGSNTQTQTDGDLAHEPLQVQDTSSTFYSLKANPDLLAINRQFGRRFVIKSFRWLNPDEI